jgi:hypothetical protein
MANLHVWKLDNRSLVSGGSLSYGGLAAFVAFVGELECL